MEENVFYKPGEPSSVMSLNEEVDLFASCVNIYTTETDVYGDIMDEPRELEVFDEGAWHLIWRQELWLLWVLLHVQLQLWQLEVQHLRLLRSRALLSELE